MLSSVSAFHYCDVGDFASTQGAGSFFDPNSATEF